jgi:hypothetical protein
MYRGYVKLWRKSIEGGWLSNAKLWTFWCWCLMKASHKEYDLVVGLQKVHLMPGDFVFGLKAASKELKMPIQPIRTILDFLKISQNITLKTTNKFSIISVVNWETYQSDENEINTQINKPLTNEQQTTNNKQTLEELKHVKKVILYSAEFELFWKEYPNKKEKPHAFNCWNKLNGQRPDIEAIQRAIQKQKDWRKNADGAFRPEWKHPAVWLNKGCWDDIPEV